MIERATVVCNNDALFLAEDVVLLSIDLKADVALTLVEKQDFSEIIQLVEENCIAWLVSWFQVAEDFDHKITVLVVTPAVVVVRVLTELLFKYEVLLVV